MSSLTLETDRLQLRTMQPADFDALLLIFTDPNVMADLASAPFDRSQMARWLQRHLEHQAHHGFGVLSVIHKGTGLLIGDCGLERMGLDDQSVVELGYDFRSDYGGQGLATEAARAVRDHELQVLGLPGLVSLIPVGNHASGRVGEKIGMTHQAEITRSAIRYWKYALEPRADPGGPEATG